MKRRTITLAIALAVVLAAIPLGTAGALADDHEQTDETDSVAPGERLAGVVGVQEAEMQGELSERTYGIKLAKAESDAERADVVDEQLADVEERLAELEQRLDDLEAARDAGEMSDGQYSAKVATVAAEKATVERTAEAAQSTAGELPEETLEERGIDVSAIEELRNRADELGGEAVAEIAQSIAGDAVGQSPAPDREPGAPIELPGPDRSSDTSDRDGNGDATGDDEDDTADESPDEYDDSDTRSDP